MKVLLIGEFSGFHNNLKDGLIEIGHDVTLASTGDGYKNFPSDYNWLPKRKGRIGYIEYLLNQYFLSNKLNNYDVIQFISNFTLFDSRFGIDRISYRKLMEKNGKSFFVLAGADPVFWKYWSNTQNGTKLINFIRDTGTQDMLPVILNRFTSEKEYDRVVELSLKAKGLIPIMHEYAQPYREFTNLRTTIPIPINFDKIEYKENIVKNGKLTCFHGLNREGAKGSKFVREAFDILKEKYPNDLELIIAGKMPYSEYVKVIANSNVIIDQTNFYSMGINGLISLAQGKIVLGGAEPESLKELNYTSCPTINIKPDAQTIVSGIEYLLENIKKISQLGNESRKFIETYHDYKIIAKGYVDQWNIES